MSGTNGGQEGRTTSHTNAEKTVRCPVEGCEKEVLRRALHLHVRQSSGNGHGENGDIPPDLDLDEAEVVGTQDVTMNYPDERDAEEVARLCPYCERPFKGKHGVMIHLGQIQGRKDHPQNASEKHEPDDFAIVHVDDNGNVTEIIEEADQTAMPSTQRRRENDDAMMGSLDDQNVEEYISDLRERGLDEEAERAEKMLLGE